LANDYNKWVSLYSTICIKNYELKEENGWLKTFMHIITFKDFSAEYVPTQGSFKTFAFIYCDLFGIINIKNSSNQIAF